MASTSALSIDGVAVGREVTPASVAELADVMRRAHAEGWSMIPVGGAARLHLGIPPRSADLALHTTRLAGIAEYEPDNMTVSVQAGTRFDSLDSVLRAQGQFLPLD